MDLEQKVVPPVYIRLLVDLFRQWDVEPDALLEGSGLDLAALADPTRHLSLAQEITVFERAEALSPVPEWALRLGQATRLQAHGVYGYAVLTSADLKQVLQVLVRFVNLTGTATGAELREHGNGDYEIRAVETVQRPNVRRSTLEEFFSSVNTGLREVTANAVTPKSLSFDYSNPGYRDVYTEVFACPVTFEAEYCGIVIDHEDLALRLPTWDPLTLEACERQCEQILEQLTAAEGFVDAVRKIMLVQPCDRRSAECVAEKLHMSTRNLRRKLEQEGTSFQKVLDDVRCELAKNYLSQTSLRLEDISPLLGFSETSNLRRAFKKWTGQTPSEYRANPGSAEA